MGFIRFVVHEIDEDSQRRRGLFHAAYALRDSGTMAVYDEERLASALRWFAVHLQKPRRFTRSARPHRRAQAICWFKSGARTHLARIREVQHLVDGYGVRVEMITSRRPGYVVYEDAFQVAACPFSETPA
jgi:hypothetical protein